MYEKLSFIYKNPNIKKLDAAPGEYIWVWRVQDDNGIGPYHRKDYDQWREQIHNESNGHPDPFDEFGAYFLVSIGFPNPFKWKFGFTSVEQYERWFSAIEILRLSNLGYKLYQMKASSVVISETQCIYSEYQEK